METEVVLDHCYDRSPPAEFFVVSKKLMWRRSSGG